ncbi:hypothetical protein C7R92_16365 [Brevibacillus porteri]|uniref:Uncharacterized protein n=1 Tax=Brevibacillus porteri TaxID=2126350 RepID=A0ABX5FNH2_9BACL|nr:hypothetical protein C7R92_16365 [Brevibacillus porteri]
MIGIHFEKSSSSSHSNLTRIVRLQKQKVNGDIVQYIRDKLRIQEVKYVKFFLNAENARLSCLIQFEVKKLAGYNCKGKEQSGCRA